MAVREILLPWDSQPQEAVWLRADLNPISGFNPAAGLVDTQGQSFTVSGTPDRLVNRFGIETDFVQASSESLMRTVSVPQWPMTFVAVFRHQAGDGGIGYLGAVATSGDKTNRVYVSGGTVAAQHIGGTTNAAATSPSFLSFGVTGVVVAVFKSATDLTVYYSGNVARGKVQTTTNVGAATTLTKLAYGVYDGSVLTRYLDGGLNFSAWFASAFDESLANAVLENPWPLFGAQSIPIPVSAGGGPPPTFIPAWAHRRARTIGVGVI